MLLIPCPHCGNRDESEFDYGGRSINLPSLNANQGDWHEAIHLTASDSEIIEETWFHSAGCECWIRLKRHRQTHAFLENQTDIKGEA